MGIFSKLFGNRGGEGGGSNGPDRPAANKPEPSPEFDMLMREAQRLQRRGQVLSQDGEGRPAAYWHGNDDAGLCISLNHNGAWLNVYLDEDEGGRVEIADAPTESDELFFAKSIVLLPHIDTVFERGSEAVKAYLDQYGWTPEDPFNDNFPHPAAEVYNTKWMDNCPFYKGDEADAIVDGWQMPWPDDDWDEVKDLELVVWTLRDSEPWIEVYKDPDGGYIVKQRIT